MTYKFNPFTGKLDLTGTGGGGSGTVSSLIGNFGGAVGPNGGGQITIIGAGGVTVTGTPGTNTLTITHSAADLTWNVIGASQTLVVNSGYIVTAGSVNLALPAVSALGDEISIILDGGTFWQVTQAGAQQIRYGTYETSAGSGTLQSSSQGD